MTPLACRQEEASMHSYLLNICIHCIMTLKYKVRSLKIYWQLNNIKLRQLVTGLWYVGRHILLVPYVCVSLYTLHHKNRTGNTQNITIHRKILIYVYSVFILRNIPHLHTMPLHICGLFCSQCLIHFESFVSWSTMQRHMCICSGAKTLGTLSDFQKHLCWVPI